MKKGLFIAISGPSGVGKGTFINMLKERFKEGIYVLSHTTRQPRAGEVNGEQYYFISEAEFKKGIEDGLYLEWALVHQGAYYGILKAPVEAALAEGKIIIREMDVQGWRSVKTQIPAEQFVDIFIVPENMELLKKHILGRSPMGEEELERRLASARVEMESSGGFQYKVVSPEGDLEKGFTELMSVVFDESEKRGLV